MEPRSIPRTPVHVTAGAPPLHRAGRHVRAACALLLLLAAPLAAQEVQVPLDTAGRVMEVDRALAQRLGLFVDEYPELQVARLFEAGDAGFVLELTLRRADRIVRQRIALTPDEVSALRARVTERLAVAVPEEVREERRESARPLFITGTTLVGIGFYSWAVPVALDVDDAELALGVFMLSAGASTLLPFILTQDTHIGYGETSAWWWGATRGIAMGAYAAEVVGDPDGQAMAAATLAGSLGLGIGGYRWARRTDMSAGTAHGIGTIADFGHLWAISSLLIVQPDFGEEAVFATLLAGSTIGLVAGARWVPEREFTWGDAEAVRTGGAVGAVAGIAAWDLISDGDGDGDVRTFGAALLAGSLGGVLMGERSTRGRDFSVGQAVLIDLGTAAGAAMGLGVALIVTSAGDDSEPYLIGTALGAAAGYMTTLGSFTDDAERRARSRWDDSRLQLHLNPVAFAPGLDRLRSTTPVPVVSLRYTF